jgi:hypothetical protein
MRTHDPWFGPVRSDLVHKDPELFETKWEADRIAGGKSEAQIRAGYIGRKAITVAL